MMKKKFFATTRARIAVLIGASAAIGAAAISLPAMAGTGSEPYFGKFTLNDLSLTGSVTVDAPCVAAWDVLTNVEKLRVWAPHLNLGQPEGKKSAEKRGDYVTFRAKKAVGELTGVFVLASPVPTERVQAVVVPDKGPWMRIQEWNFVPAGDKKCLVDYNESYNEIWTRKIGIHGSRFIADNRDHHIHVVLRRMKLMAEGKEAGPPEETTYLLQDAREFPAKFVKK